MSQQDLMAVAIIALVVFFFWTIGVGLLWISMLLGHHHRGKLTYNWVKRLYERLDKEQP